MPLLPQPFSLPMQLLSQLSTERQSFFFRLLLPIFFVFLSLLRQRPIWPPKQLIDPQEPKQASSRQQPSFIQLEQPSLRNELISEQPTFQHF